MIPAPCVYECEATSSNSAYPDFLKGEQSQRNVNVHVQGRTAGGEARVRPYNLASDTGSWSAWHNTPTALESVNGFAELSSAFSCAVVAFSSTSRLLRHVDDCPQDARKVVP